MDVIFAAWRERGLTVLLRDAQRRPRGTRAAPPPSRRRPGPRRVTGPAGIVLDGVSRAYATPAGPVRAVDGITLRVEPGSEPGHHGAERLRQVDAARPDRGARGAHRGPHLDRRVGALAALRARAGRPAPASARARLPGRQPPALPDRRGERRAPGRARHLGLRRRARPAAARPTSGSPTISTSCPTSSRAGSASAWRSPGPSSKAPRVILADEPTGSLDAGSSTAVIDLLLRRPAGDRRHARARHPRRRGGRAGRPDGAPARRPPGPRHGRGAPGEPERPVLRYVWRDLVRNPRRTVASVIGVTLGVGLFSAVLFFIDGSGATMTKRALAPLALDLQVVMTSPLGGGLRLDERLVAPRRLRRGQRARLTLTVRNEGAVPANEVVVDDEPPPPLAYVPGTTTLDGQAACATARAPARSPRGWRGPGSTSGPSRPARPSASPTRRAPRAPCRGRRPAARRARSPAARTSCPRRRTRRRRSRSTQLTAEDRERSRASPPRTACRSSTCRPGRCAPVAGRPAPGAGLRLRSPLPAALPVDPGRRRGVRDGRRPLLSAEARARSRLSAGAADRSSASRRAPRRCPCRSSGVADLSRAKPLFYSRKSNKLEDFLYVPDAVVVSPATFQRAIVPAFRPRCRARHRAQEPAGAGGRRARRPVAAAVRIPPAALAQTEAIARSIRRDRARIRTT